MTQEPPGGKRRHGRVSSLLIAAGCSGMIVLAAWAPVARAQLILSAIAIAAVWFKPPEK